MANLHSGKTEHSWQKRLPRVHCVTTAAGYCNYSKLCACELTLACARVCACAMRTGICKRGCGGSEGEAAAAAALEPCPSAGLQSERPSAADGPGGGGADQKQLLLI